MSLIERAVHERRRPATATAAIGARPPSVGNLIRPRVQTPSGQRSEISNTPVVPADRCIELDLKQLAASSHLVPRNLRSPLAREISAIKRALEPSITDGREGRPEGPLVVAVTSTNPREGKSFLSLNLGFFYLFSEVRPVLLVDMDTIACGLSRSLGVADRSGLAERVPEQLQQIGDCLLQTRREPLSILPAGKLPASAVDWTRRDCQQMVSMARKMAPPNGVIIIDTAPLTALPTAHLLCDYVDRALFVVGAGQTTPDQIALALAQIGNQQAVRFVLNRASIASTAAEYRYKPGG